jgi:DNA-binding NarL/FixJ family response regulator
MINPQTLPVIALICAALSLFGAALAITLLLQARADLKRAVSLVADLKEALAGASHEMDTLSQRASDQARRLAWLELRARAMKAEPERLVGSEPIAPAKTNITERRHRVLTLAKRGLSPESIAATLGLPLGEVELIIGLNTAA